MSEQAKPRRLAEQVVDTRVAMYHLGVDVGSAARVLAICGLVRLVWARPTKTLVGIPGLGMYRQQASTLALRTFKRHADGVLQWDHEQDLVIGGRMSKARLREHRARIDEHFGPGATDALDPRATIVFGDDLVGDYIAARQAQPPYVSPAALELMEKAHTATVSRADFEALQAPGSGAVAV